MMSTFRLIGVILASWFFVSVVLGVMVGRWLERASRVRPQLRFQTSSPAAAARAKVEPKRSLAPIAAPALASASRR
jgi:hypothetical protein